jgi:hypothetical protein
VGLLEVVRDLEYLLVGLQVIVSLECDKANPIEKEKPQ